MKHSVSFLCMAAMALLTVGCAITDYDGITGRQTSAEAKLFGTEISFILGDPNLDGTYAYTVKYNNRTGRDPGMKIITYRNPVPSSFSRDGVVDRDGDDVQGRSGILGGKFLPQWVAVDPLPGCQFDANITQDHSKGAGPLASLCEVVLEEIDKDLELQASFSNAGDLLGQIWTGALNDGFTAELNGITIDGVNVPLANVVTINAKANGVRPIYVSVDLTQPGGRDLIQAILANTQDGVPVSLGFSFAGGMTLGTPGNAKAAFDHTALWNAL